MMTPAKAFLSVCLVALITLWAGCASTSAYVGQGSQPTVTDQTYTHWNASSNSRMPVWETHHVLVFENPLFKPVSFDIDCANNYFQVDLPARTVDRLLLVPQDGSCTIE